MVFNPSACWGQSALIRICLEWFESGDPCPAEYFLMFPVMNYSPWSN